MRRRKLVAQSEELRDRLAEDLSRLDPALGWIERGYALVQSRAFLPLVSVAGGLFVARSRSRWLAKGARLFSAWRVAKIVARLLTSYLKS